MIALFVFLILIFIACLFSRILINFVVIVFLGINISSYIYSPLFNNILGEHPFILMILLIGGISALFQNCQKYTILRALCFITIVSLLVRLEYGLYHYYAYSLLHILYWLLALSPLYAVSDKDFHFQRGDDPEENLGKSLGFSLFFLYPLCFGTLFPSWRVFFDDSLFLIILLIGLRINLFPFLFSSSFCDDIQTFKKEKSEYKENYQKYASQNKKTYKEETFRKQSEEKIKKKNTGYVSFCDFWEDLALKTQKTSISTEVNRILTFVKSTDTPRDLAKSFFSFGVRWTKNTYLEAIFREQWKGVLKDYKKGNEIEFSWNALEAISAFMLSFLFQYADARREEQLHKRREKKRQEEEFERRKRQRSNNQNNQGSSSSSSGRRRSQSRPKRPWYEVLDVDSNASFEEIKKAYRKKMFQYHPDRCAKLSEAERLEAEEISKEINEAFQEIKERQKG